MVMCNTYLSSSLQVPFIVSEGLVITDHVVDSVIQFILRQVHTSWTVLTRSPPIIRKSKGD